MSPMRLRFTILLTLKCILITIETRSPHIVAGQNRELDNATGLTLACQRTQAPAARACSRNCERLAALSGRNECLTELGVTDEGSDQRANALGRSRRRYRTISNGSCLWLGLLERRSGGVHLDWPLAGPGMANPISGTKPEDRARQA